MPVIAVIGAQWGDEGKGKIVDMLAEKADVVVRFSGGDNAGHTVINHYGEFKLHLIPSGIFSKKATCIIGNGVVVNPSVLLEEIEVLKAGGIDTSRLFISDRANLIMPYHVLQDGLEEKDRGGKAIGTTKKGIGPAFADKIARMGIRAGDLLDKETFKEKLGTILEYKNRLLTRVLGAEPVSFDEIYEQYCHYGDIFADSIRETIVMVHEAMDRQETVMLEGAQGTLLDPDFGTYPYSTSSSPMVGGASLGSGISPKDIDRAVGVFKAYTTRVGAGPMPTELNNEIGESIRKRANEYGATTGRPRRCGWFDAVAARYSNMINGFTGLALTRLDILDIMPAIKICGGYKLDGEVINYFPASIASLEKCEPVLEELPGWETPISDIREYEQLPVNAKNYINRLEEIIGCPANIISVGAAREQTIHKEPIW